MFFLSCGKAGEGSRAKFPLLTVLTISVNFFLCYERKLKQSSRRYVESGRCYMTWDTSTTTF